MRPMAAALSAFGNAPYDQSDRRRGRTLSGVRVVHARMCHGPHRCTDAWRRPCRRKRRPSPESTSSRSASSACRCSVATARMPPVSRSAPREAIHRFSDDGPVLLEAERCIVCRLCLIVCPFGVIDISRNGKAVIKCDQCLERTEAGEDPACVTACPTGAPAVPRDHPIRPRTPPRGSAAGGEYELVARRFRGGDAAWIWPRWTRSSNEYERDKSWLVMILQDVQGIHNYLPPPALWRVAERLDIGMAHVYNVATFYSSFSLKERGRHLIRVCDGTACHFRGAVNVRDEITPAAGDYGGRDNGRQAVHVGGRGLSRCLCPGAGDDRGHEVLQQVDSQKGRQGTRGLSAGGTRGGFRDVGRRCPGHATSAAARRKG